MEGAAVRLPQSSTACAMLLLLVICVVAAGCFDGGSAKKQSAVSARRAVLYSGVHFGILQRVTRYSDAEAQRRGQHAESLWRAVIRGRAARWPQYRFDNLPASELRHRLARLARRYRFRVVSVKLLKPEQLAPEVVVGTRHYVALARATGKILQRIDRGYEGFYFEAVDERGLPFLLAYKFRRGPSGGGGYWARSDRLMPFAHL
jgi:hypothetical protein